MTERRGGHPGSDGFTRRHERELAEIKALGHELDKNLDKGLDTLERIKESQDRALRRAGFLPPLAVRRFAAQDERRANDEAEADGDDPAPLLAFVHIPKTAGGTVMSMFVAAYSRAAVRDAGNYFRNPEKTALKVKQAMSVKPRKTTGRVSAGHVPYGVFREHLPANTRYMTFLREPVDRVISQYWRHIRRQDPSRAGLVKKKAGARIKAESLEEALIGMRLPQINNLATRLLCGDPSPLGDLPASAVNDAKMNLRDFAFVGVQERFEESIILLRRALGLGQVSYEDRHVSSDRPAVDEIPARERALIAQHNRLDAELYEFALRLFEDAVAAAGDRFAAEVATLRGSQ